jgi:uncharacterized protein
MSHRHKKNRHPLSRKLAKAKVRTESAPSLVQPSEGREVSSSAPVMTVERAAYRMRIQIFEQSRNAGSAIAGKELEGGNSQPALLSIAAKVSAFADQTIAMINQRYRPPLNCKEGCSYCCRKPGVLVAFPELLRLVEHVRRTFSETEITELAERARGYAVQMEGRNCNAPLKESVPCPLLVNERCSVYEVRPLVCRGYNSTSVDACREAHEKADALVPIFAPIKDVTDGATVGLEQQLGAHGLNDAMLDLGLALNLAMTARENSFEAIAEGNVGLAVAENKTWADDLLVQVREIARRVGVEI